MIVTSVTLVHDPFSNIIGVATSPAMGRQLAVEHAQGRLVKEGDQLGKEFVDQSCVPGWHDNKYYLVFRNEESNIETYYTLTTNIRLDVLVDQSS